MDRLVDRSIPFLFGALLLVSCFISWTWSDMKVRYEVMQDQRPRFCLSCDGVGEIDLIERRVEDGKAVEVKLAEPCSACKGSGVTRNYLGKRKQIELPGVGVRDTPGRCGHATALEWEHGSLTIQGPRGASTERLPPR